MKYVNLKKRNTSKFQYLSSRVAIGLALSLTVLSLVIIPIASRVNNVRASADTQNINEEYIDNQIDVLENLDLNLKGN